VKLVGASCVELLIVVHFLEASVLTPNASSLNLDKYFCQTALFFYDVERESG